MSAAVRSDSSRIGRVGSFNLRHKYSGAGELVPLIRGTESDGDQNNGAGVDKAATKQIRGDGGGDCNLKP